MPDNAGGFDNACKHGAAKLLPVRRTLMQGRIGVGNYCEEKSYAGAVAERLGDVAANGVFRATKGLAFNNGCICNGQQSPIGCKCDGHCASGAEAGDGNFCSAACRYIEYQRALQGILPDVNRVYECICAFKSVGRVEADTIIRRAGEVAVKIDSFGIIAVLT